MAKRKLNYNKLLFLITAFLFISLLIFYMTNALIKRNYYKKLSEYKEMQKNNSIFKVVNKDIPIDPEYEPNDLVNINLPKSEDKEIQLRKEAYRNLEKMFNDAKNKDGINLEVISGYRDFTYQWNTYNNWVAELGEKKANKVSAKPGSSEHQTGLAVDLFEVGEAKSKFLEEDFENTKAFSWLDKNAKDYGFILRFPKDKTNITKYSYEPWHYRYVGVKLAKKIKKDNLTLEEWYEKERRKLNL